MYTVEHCEETILVVIGTSRDVAMEAARETTLASSTIFAFQCWILHLGDEIKNVMS